MKTKHLTLRSFLGLALGLTCFGILGNQSEAATLLDFDFNGDTVGNLPTGWNDSFSSQSDRNH